MKVWKIILLICVGIFVIGLVIPYNFQNPVEGGTKRDYHPQSYWYYPWGTSITHKGVDIFKKKGAAIHPASNFEWVLYAGHMPGKGGNVVITLAPKWKLHYYAHMDEVKAIPLSMLTHNSKIGTVGNSGNAAKTPSHLHFGMGTLLLQPWEMDNSPDGWKKVFYMNPITFLDSYHNSHK